MACAASRLASTRSLALDVARTPGRSSPPATLSRPARRFSRKHPRRGNSFSNVSDNPQKRRHTFLMRSSARRIRGQNSMPSFMHASRKRSCASMSSSTLCASLNVCSNACQLGSTTSHMR